MLTCEPANGLNCFLKWLIICKIIWNLEHANAFGNNQADKEGVQHPVHFGANFYSFIMFYKLTTIVLMVTIDLCDDRGISFLWASGGQAF